MCPGQRESGGGVVECRARPVGRGVALLTSLRESGLNVVRIRSAVEVLNMTRSAISRRSHELAVDMALGAADIHVAAGERELGKGGVIEGRRIPSAAVVASLTGSGESGLRVRRIVGLVEVGQVAADAGSWSANKLSARVARVAIQGGVGPH